MSALSGMDLQMHDTGRAMRWPLVLLALGCLALAGCSSLPRSTLTADTRAELESRFEDDAASAYQVGETFRGRGDWRALRWYERSAMLAGGDGHWSTSAEYRLGTIHASGRLDGDDTATPTIRPNLRKARVWHARAAYHGSPYAWSGLRTLYQQQGDTDMTLRWALRRAVYLRHLYRMAGDRLAPPEGVANPLDAIRAGAARGDAEALVDLGAMYEGGVLVERDREAALDCYRRAAAQGNVFGQYFAGLLLGRQARGEVADGDEASRWFAMAQAQGFYLAEPEYWREAIKPVVFNFSS